MVEFTKLKDVQTTSTTLTRAVVIFSPRPAGKFTDKATGREIVFSDAHILRLVPLTKQLPTSLVVESVEELHSIRDALNEYIEQVE